MKRKRIILLFSVIVGAVMGIGLESYAQLNISKEKIPSYVSDEIRILIERLYSSAPVERGRAAHDLGEMGKKADPSIPFLMGILGDSSPLGRTPDDYYAGLFDFLVFGCSRIVVLG